MSRIDIMVKDIGLIYILSKQKCMIRFVTKRGSRKTNDVISYMDVKMIML